jgi:IS6 family transposase
VTKKRPALFHVRHFEDVIILLCVRRYLRYSLSYRDLEEIMAERGLSVDHVTIWRWVQRYAPILNQRLRRELRPSRSWRVDETYVRVAEEWAYLYRAIDSAGETIDFLLSPKRDLVAAKLFPRLALSAHPELRPRVIKVDGHPAYARATEDLKQSGELGRGCHCRTSPYLNNILEQDHRFIKKRVNAGLGFRSAEGAWRTIEGYEAMHAIRKGQVRWLGKGDVVGQRQFRPAASPKRRIADGSSCLAARFEGCQHRGLGVSRYGGNVIIPGSLLGASTVRSLQLQVFGEGR